MTTTLTQQLHLVNIISLAEDKLQSNFAMILNRLREHDKLIAQNSESIHRSNRIHDEKLQFSVIRTEQKFGDVFERLQNIKKDIDIGEEKTKINKMEIQESKNLIQGISDNLINTKQEINEQFLIKENEVHELNRKADQIFLHIGDIQNSLQTKENITEVQKLVKQLNELHKKHHLVDSDIKLLQHKMEKMEILSQKAERQQAKKEADFMKQIQEKVKKQIKGSQVLRESMFSPSVGERLKLQEEQMEKQMKSSSMNLEKNVTHIGQKMISIQNQVKEMQETVKYMKQLAKKQATITGQGLHEKLNEFKSEMIKLWAKCDTIDNKIAFTDRKMQEKTKLLNGLLDLQKENSWAKMDDKLKTFQTQMYTFIKEMKVKVEGKIGSHDYEKYNQNIEAKIKQINEQIYLKSDKIEVKKALLFLQSKIKELILVISEDEENEKDALLTKKQLKCMSCDKDVQKIAGCSNMKGNWDNLPYRDHAPEILGRFGMTNYGSLAKKLKKLQNQDLPILSKKYQNRQNQSSTPKSP